MTGFITFRSVTFAQRGESVLRQAGISGSVQRTPRWMEEQGCGYCLRLRSRELQAAAQILTQQQIPFRKVYQRRENGTVEEVGI